MMKAYWPLIVIVCVLLAILAFNVKASGYVRFKSVQIGEIIPSSGFSLTIPDVIGEATVDSPVMVAIASSNFGRVVLIDDDQWWKLQNGDEPLVIIGNISYNDTFGNVRITPFHFEWRAKEDSGWGDLDVREKWTRYSSEST